MPTPWTRRARLGWTIATVGLYALAGVPLTAWLGPAAGSLSVLPVALAAALLGWRGGLALALLCIPLSTLHLNLAGYPGWDTLFRHGGGPGIVALLAVGGVAGWLRTLVARLRGAEAALRAREARHRAVVDTAFDAIVTAGADGCIQSFNRGAERVFGYPAAEVLGQPLTILMPEQFRTAHEAGMRRYQATGTPVVLGRTVELVGRRKDGTEFPLEAALTEGHEGGVAFFTGILRDITPRKGAETALRASEERLRAQYNGFPIPTLTWQRRDDDFVLLDYNAAALAFTQGTVVGLLGTSCRELNRDRPGIVADFERCYCERAVVRSEVAYSTQATGAAKQLVVTYVYAPPDLVMVHTEDATERWVAEAALRQSAESFADLFDAADDAIAITEGGQVVAINRAYTALLGFTPEDVVGRMAADFALATDQTTVETHISAGYTRPYEVLHPRKDGTTISVELLGTAIRYRGQSARLTTLRDISARKAAEATLRASEERFRLLAENAEDVIFRYRLLPTRGFEYVSPSATVIGGYTPEEHYADPDLLMKMIHPDDRARLLDVFPHPDRPAATAAEQAGAAPMRWCRKDGSEYWADSRITVVRDQAGRVVAIEGIVRDVTARVAAEAAVRASEAHFRSVVETLTDGVVVQLPDGSIRTCNASAERLLGMTVAQMERRAPIDPGWRSVDGDGQPITAENHPAIMTLRTGVPQSNALMAIHKPDGNVTWISVDTQMLRDADTAAPYAVVSALTDITARVDAEAALRAEERRARELYTAAERQARELELLDRVRTALARELDPAAVFQTIVEAIASIFGHTRVSLYLLEGDELVRQQVVGQPSRLVRLPVARGIMGRVARTGRPVVLEDVDTDPEFIRAMPGIVSEVCVPLFDEGRVAGVLNLESTDGVRLGEADLRLMTGLSEQVGIAIGRARLYAEARANADNLAAAQRIAHLGSWEYDYARDEVRWSDEVFRILGYAPQAFVPTPKWILTAMHPEDQAWVERAHQALVQDGTPFDLDYRILRPDGEVRMLHQQAETVLDPEGRPVKRVGIMQDVTERRALEAQLRHQAFHDPLTGLPNRARFLDRLDHALARARRGGRAGAVLFLDLDRFKDVNDSLGHGAGDRLLVAVAGRLRRCLRDEDTLARLGGDEFTVLLEDVADAGAAARLAERLATALDPPISLDGQEHRVTASVGIVLASGDYGRAEEVLRDADVAMYRAKAAGKARYAVFDPAMQTAVQARLALEQDLRRALEREEFVLHYQPIVDLQTGRASKVEALVRWYHPERGLVPPGAFLALAEEAGLIVPLGRWVLREACRQGRAWRDAGHDLTIAVNLTAQEFQRPELVAEVAAALRAVGLDPRWLTLEITEGAAMGDAATTVETLEALRVLGVGVAIDDFGTGYSSLAYLQRFPVDALKVDKAFVDGLGGPGEDTAIVEAVVTLARTLGLGVVAEGVETAAQAARLAALGCGLGQGYHFARPLPAAEIPALLARRWPAEAPLFTIAD